MMRVAIVGGTGFIGTQLTQHLVHLGHQVTILTRSNKQRSNNKQMNHSLVSYVEWPLPAKIDSFSYDAVINLAGETINQRWTTKAKERILHSRVETTAQLMQALQQGTIKTERLINGSAIGYYGTSVNQMFDESDQQGDDFLAQVVGEWEQTADQAEKLGIRLVKLRIGLVLGKKGGALPKMALPYRLWLGGRVGSGQQWISWIHIGDLVQLILFSLENEFLSGPINATAPHPVRMNQFGEELAKVLKKPHWLPLPSFVLQTLLGQMSSLLLEGQHVIPEKARTKGFSFQFPKLDQALEDLLH